MYILIALLLPFSLLACAPDHIVSPPPPWTPVDVQGDAAPPSEVTSDGDSDGGAPETEAVDTALVADTSPAPDVRTERDATVDVQADTAADVGTPGACSTATDCPRFPQWRCGTSTGLARCACTSGGAVGACGGQDTDCDGREDPFIRCSGLCSDPRTDARNCGRCGNTCAAGEVCVSSSCACPAFVDNAERCLFCVRNCLGPGAHSVCCPAACAATSHC